MKHKPRLYLGLGLILVAIHAQAMDNNQKQPGSPSKSKQLISPGKLRALTALDLDNRPSDAFSSPTKSPVKSGKQEVESPTKVGGYSKADLEALSGAFNSPEKSINNSINSEISPAGKFHVGFPQKYCYTDITHKSLKQMEKGDEYFAVGFQIPEKNRIKLLIDKIKSGISVNMILDHNTLIKDKGRLSDNQSLAKLQQAGANLLIFNAQQNVVDANGKPIVLHAKEEAFTKKGQLRVFGLASHNKTEQANKNEEMCCYSKDAQDYGFVKALFDRMKPYSTTYNLVNNNTISAQPMVIDIPKLPAPSLFNGGKLTISTDQANWGPLVERLCENEATHVSSYSIGDPYLARLIKNKALQQIIVNSECYNKNSGLQKAWQNFANKGIGAYVFSHPSNILHTKFALLRNRRTLMSSANFMENGFMREINTVTLTDDPTIYASCEQGFKDQINHENTKQVMLINTNNMPKPPSPHKRKLDNNNNDEVRNSTSGGVKRILFK